MVKRLLLISVLIVGLFLFIVPKIAVAVSSPIWDDSPAKHAKTLEDSAKKGVITGLESYTQLQISANIAALGVQILGYRPDTGGPVQGGAVQFLANGIEYMVKTPPASSIDYIAYMGHQLKIPGAPATAYAADDNPGGLGFNRLSPIIPIWTLMRNLAYLIFAVIFVMAGLMIMFRVKVDPKTAASIQSALPKVVLALILVTFSYAIAGFLIDLMYVALALIVTLMSSITVSGSASLEQLLSGSIFEFVFNGGWFGTTLGVAQAVFVVVDNIFGASKGFIGPGSTVLSLVAGGLAFLIVGIAILWALFKTWLALIGAYANIILGIIFAPLQLMLDAIPGQNQFSGWLRSMMANLLAFPVVVIMLAVGSAIATNFGKGIDPNIQFTGFVPPLLGAGTQQTVQAFIGLGILLTIPKVLDILKEVLKAPAFKYGTAWSDALGVGMGTTSATGQGAYGRVVGPGQAAWDTYQDAQRKARFGGPPVPPTARPTAGEWLAGHLPKAGGSRR